MHFKAYFLILLIFLESLKFILIHMVTIVMMSTELVTVDLPKIKAFSNKVYDVIMFVHDVTNIILS